MKLLRLRIERLPGIDAGYELDALAAGINVVHGPNGSGKSSLCRAFRALVYQDELVAGPHDLECTLEVGGETVRVERQSNQVQWATPAGAGAVRPRLPEHRHIGCYTIGIDDLLAAGGNEVELAERVARELAGGFDVPGVLHCPPFRGKANHGSVEAKRLRDASAKLMSTQHEHSMLRVDADRVAVLEGELSALQRAIACRSDYEAALGAVYEGRKRRAAQREFDGFESYLAHLIGDEVERLKALHTERLAVEQSIRQLAVGADHAHGRAVAAGYSQSSELPVPDLVELARSRLATLHELEARMAELSVRYRVASTARVTALAALGSAGVEADGPAPDIDARPAMMLSLESIGKAENALGAKRQYEARLAGLDAALDELGPAAGVPPRPPRTESELDVYREARSALFLWLGSQPGGRVTTGGLGGWGGGGVWYGSAWRSIARWVALLGAFMASVICIAYGGWGFVGLLLAPAAAGVAWTYQDRSERRGAQFAQMRHRATGVECPKWERAEVEIRLGELDETVRNAALAIARHQRWVRVQEDRRKTEDALNTEIQGLEHMGQTLGFSPMLLDASFERWLRISRDFDLAQRNIDEVAAEMGVVSGRRDELVRRLTAALPAGALQHPGAEDGDALGIGHALRGFERRAREGAQAHAELESAQRERLLLEERLRALCDAHQALYSGVALGWDDEAALSRGVNLLPAYRLAERTLRDAQATERRAVEGVTRQAELRALIDADDESGLIEKLDQIGRADEAARTLIDEIAEIAARVRYAGRGHDLEEASAEQHAAHDALTEARDAADLAALGSFLLRTVEAEHVQSARPAVIKEADRLFAQFTKHRFGLGFTGRAGFVSANLGPRSTPPPKVAEFLAVDRERNRELPLSHLSVGTRMQLLLALRLAFAKELEADGEPLPLFVDEALATADPERFSAVAQALGEIAGSENRQVIYLTAHPYEVAQWQGCGADVNVIDLAAVRGHAHAVRRWGEVAAERRTPIPAPGAHGAAHYANVLGVPAIDPWAAAGGVHAFHLLRDDLDGVKQLLELGITSAGPLHSFIANEAGERILGRERCRRLSERVAILTAFSEAWREGRGCPLREADLANAPLTNAFED